MTSIIENLTSQIGVGVDVFTTVNPVATEFMLFWNGMNVNGDDITNLPPNQFQLSFVPNPAGVTDTLFALFCPEKFTVTNQVDGVTFDFTKDPLDTGSGDFVAILNGQLLASETLTIDASNFRLTIPVAPKIGDELCYIRVENVRVLGTSIIVDGAVELLEATGSIDVKVIQGVVQKIEVEGAVSFFNVDGYLEINEINGEVKC